MGKCRYDLSVDCHNKNCLACVLDKIRAEIEQKCCITVGRENDPAITLHDVFEIINKYKTESKE